MANAIAQPDVKKQFDSAGFDAESMTPAQFVRFLAEDIARYAAIGKAAGIVKQ